MSYVIDEVRGVTQLDNIVYAVCVRPTIIAMYTADTLSPLGEGIHVDGMKDPCDIVACRRDRQLYVADKDYCIWRVSTDDHSDYEKWLTTDTFLVYSLSMTSRGVLVTSWQPPTLYEYSTVDAQLLHAVHMPPFVKCLWHGVETSRGTFVISHRGTTMVQDSWQHAVSELFNGSLDKMD